MSCAQQCRGVENWQGGNRQIELCDNQATNAQKRGHGDRRWECTFLCIG